MRKAKRILLMLGMVSIAMLCAVNADEQEPVHEHEWGEPVAVEPATCTSEGLDVRTCVCGAEESITIPMTEHEWGDFTTKLDPTCSYDGEKMRECQNCDAIDYEIIERLSHVPVIDDPIDATCFAEGKTEGSHCSECGEVIQEQQTLPMKEHVFVENGECKHVCTNDGCDAVEECTTTSNGTPFYACQLAGLDGTFIEDTEGTLWYVQNGQLDTGRTGLVKCTVNDVLTWWYVNAGQLDTSYNGLAKNEWGWFYCTDGMLDRSFNGFAPNPYGWWYCENGTIVFGETGLVKGYIDGDYAWRYVSKGQVKLDYTGFGENEWGWWYMNNGTLDREKTGLVYGSADNEQAWRYVSNGQVKLNYTGFGENDWGWWYLNNGKIDKNKSELVYGTAAGESTWWYVKEGQIKQNYTGLGKNDWGWWYCKNGKIDRTYNGFAQNPYGWWYCENGTIDFSKNGMEYGNAGGEWTWRFVRKGQAIMNYTGISENEYGTWCFQNGKINKTYTGAAKRDNGKWYYCVNGKIQTQYRGTTNLGGKYYYFHNDGSITYNVEKYNGNYVEVNIDEQIVYIFKNGALFTSTPCVTGCVSTGHSTRKGEFTLYSKVRNTVLRGDDYESYVDYWMAFDRWAQNGLHDATWRGSFGGSIYRYNGSHGCVNLPWNAARTIYENVPQGTTVWVH